MSMVLAPATYGKPDPASRLKGIAIVVALHVLIGYALVSGMARKGLDLVKKPLEAVVIQEVMIAPPPPPPPPKTVELPKEAPKPQAPPLPFVPPPDVAPPTASAAPVIAATPTPPPAPAAIAPPAPPAPPSPAPAPAAIGSQRAAIAVVCPTQVAPDMPRRAIQEGTEGVVKAQILIKNGVVQQVTILSGPMVFHAAVRKAIGQYRCVADGPEVLATQEFSFRLD
jgi:protein TonB